jgi:peptidyl-prolyl cis-trans isomerase A (cyclophilin A)/peptidyl-prolyl cis-trans isomerase B (cyclophilin B)
MARTSDPNSATAQFFINHKNNDFLNHTAPTPQGWGYAVFGKVIKGMDVVNKIAAIPTGPRGPFPSDVPSQPVIIEDARVLTSDKPASK